jgi:hypothetical protein
MKKNESSGIIGEKVKSIRFKKQNELRNILPNAQARYWRHVR